MRISAKTFKFRPDTKGLSSTAFTTRSRVFGLNRLFLSLLAALLILFSISSAADIKSNNSFSFQGYMTDSNGKPIVIGTRMIGFRFYKDKNLINRFAQATPHKVTIKNGNYATKIVADEVKSTANINRNMNHPDYNTNGLTLLSKYINLGNVYMEVYIAPENTAEANVFNNQYKLSPPVQMTSAPFSLSTSGIYVNFGGYNNDTNKLTVGIGTTAVNNKMLSVLGDTIITGDTTVVGDTLISGDIKITENMVVGGITSLNDDTTVSGDIEVKGSIMLGSSPPKNIFQLCFDSAHPVGEYYIQFPGLADPEALYNKSINGYTIQSTWSNISSQYAGDFFRAEGGIYAKSFNGGRQMDALQDHLHDITDFHEPVWNSEGGGGNRGRANGRGKQITQTWSVAGSARIANETRPVNRTIRIWKRIQ